MNKLWVRIACAVVIGLLFAGAFTHITYPCGPSDASGGESALRCVAFEKAVMHPADLIHNKQNSLLHFSDAFAIASLTSFALVSIYGRNQRRRAQA